MARQMVRFSSLTVGLAFSGGGVRAASQALGVLDALKKHHCIDTVDYLSSVSGGGYCGERLPACHLL